VLNGLQFLKKLGCQVSIFHKTGAISKNERHFVPEIIGITAAV
jgi:hypothetical protein